MTAVALSPVQASAAQAGAGTSPAASTDQTDDGFSFDDLLDIINPLQHIPIISTIYRHLTGDTIKPLEQIAGDTLYGGLTGLASSVANFAFEKVAGENLGDMVYAFVTGEDDKTTQVAAADTSQVATHAPTPLLGAQLAQPASTPSNALIAAAEAKGISPGMASRALSAYQASMLLPKMAAASVP